MVEVNKRYRIIKNVTLSVIDEKTSDQLDFIVGSDSGQFSFDGSNILFHDAYTGKTHTSINMNGFIDAMVEVGRLEPAD